MVEPPSEQQGSGDGGSVRPPKPVGTSAWEHITGLNLRLLFPVTSDFTVCETVVYGRTYAKSKAPSVTTTLYKIREMGLLLSNDGRI